MTNPFLLLGQAAGTAVTVSGFYSLSTHCISVACVVEVWKESYVPHGQTTNHGSA